MANNARVRPLTSAPFEVQAEGAVVLATPIERVLERLWHLLTSMRFVLIVILALAALALIGTVIVQAPPGVFVDPQAKADWISQVRPKYGGWTGVFDVLQFFIIFSSIWFKVLVTALSVSLVACSTHRVSGLWRTAAHPRIIVGDRFLEHAPQREMILGRQGPDVALARIRDVLHAHHYRSMVEEGDALHLYADRNRWAPLGSLIGHLSLLFILAGAIAGSTLGYRDTSFVVAEGSTAAVATDGLSVKLISFKDAYYADTGAPSDYASDLVLYQDGRQVARQVVRVNEPLRYGDVSFYQSFFGPAAAMTVTDAAGKQLFASGVPLAWSTNDSSRRVGTFVLSGAKLTIWVVESAGADDTLIKPGQVRLEIYTSDGDGQPIAIQTLDQGKPATVKGFTFTFERENAFTGLTVSRDPGAPVVWLGAGMLIVGFAVVFMFPHRRLWGRISARGGRSSIALAAICRNDTTVGREFTELVTDIRRALQAPAKS